MFKNYKINPAQIILSGYLIMIIAGALFLSLPIATSDRSVISPIDALFTSTSAVCVTGLIVMDNPSVFSKFGMAVILILIQLGGLGYMVISTSLMVLFNRKLAGTIRHQTIEEFQRFSAKEIRHFSMNILIFTFSIETIGTALLFPKMLMYTHSVPLALYHSIFQSVSAFCNAGFSTFSQSLTPFAADPVVNITVLGLIICGGLGFIVIADVYRNLFRRTSRALSPHSRIVLTTTFFLIAIPFILFFFLERGNAMIEMSLLGKVFASLFQTVTPRTAGFNTLDMASLRPATLFMTILLMFIGGSPGGTAGGIKTTTFFVLFYSLYGKLRRRKNINIFYRKISEDTILKSFFILFMSICIISLGIFLISLFEKSSFLPLFFEIFSAFGTVGLSIGAAGKAYSLSGLFTPAGKIVIILLMFAGRVGVMTAVNAFIYNSKKETVNYPDTKLIIG